MKTDKRTQLLKILSDASQSISSAALANMLGTSERTVRNYIKAINEEGKAVITSSREGYRLESHTASLDTLPNEAESRVWKVLSDLLTSKEGVNAFDEAEALYVSSSTILNTVIPQVKEIAKEYDLRIESQKYQFYLRGSEQNRRKMIGSLAVRNTYGFFNSKDALEQLFPSQDIDGIMQELFTTCQESKLFLNDFALNNLLIHILVILIRLNIGNELDDKEPPISVDELLASSQDREDIVNLADMISANFEQKYSIRIPERDYKQILMLIALSVEHETVDIQCVISPEFIHNVASILSMMSQRYCTPEFDNDYILQFSLHMYYAQQRCAFHISYPNPIALQFKKDYAPVYDMAVYFAHRFAQIYHIEVNEDEIAFIAFHIGSYLENNKQSREHATCVVIVESYHMLARQLIHEINVAFANQIIVKEVLPLNRYLNRQPECDLVLTTLPLGIQHPHMVQISPILTKANCESIRAQLSSISTERELARAHQFLQSLLHKELYFRNVSLSDAAAYIHFMGEQCVKHGYAKEEFVHAAKGLEFTNVFVVGLEEDLFPSSLSKDNPRAVEEERRLFYVAITRAEQNCVLSYAKSRYRNGKTDMCTPSRFLKDIDAKYLDMPSDAGASDAFASARERYGRPAFASPFRQPRAVEDDFVSPVKQAAQRQGHLTKLKNTMESSFSAAPATDLSGLHVGSKVRHDRFGEGEIVSIEGEGGNAKATVAFDHFGQKQLLLKFAKLTMLND